MPIEQDCTDNVATRYLLSDASVIANRPLVYGSAIRTYGQVAVYHYKRRGSASASDTDTDQWHQYGPCYRCIHPRAMNQSIAGNCSDEGVLGPGMQPCWFAGWLVGLAIAIRWLTYNMPCMQPVTSIIGSMQVMEVIKVIIGCESVLDSRMILADAMAPSYRIVKLCARREDCVVCGRHPTIKRESLTSATSISEYLLQCTVQAKPLLAEPFRISVLVWLNC
jgi:adenylyltransferase and sulfurtransferase